MSAAAAEEQWDDTDTRNLDMSDLAGPFEGPEKLLEIWFAPSVQDLPECASLQVDDLPTKRTGLRRVPKSTWEQMLELVKCKTLSVESNAEMDAYLLSESSMFVFPHKLILKTCGTTTLLLGLERLLRIATTALFDDEHVPYGSSVSSTHLDAALALCTTEARQLAAHVYRCFYSRKSFMFPEKQKGPHRDWMLETALLDRYFASGSAYTVGRMNGNHWLLYMACNDRRTTHTVPSNDMTLEILMTELAPDACAHFAFDAPSTPNVDKALRDAHALGAGVSRRIGLASLFPSMQLDAFAFEPCGYSANALVPAAEAHAGGYWTVHVTPEQGSSYASFETNIALECDTPTASDRAARYATNAHTLTERVLGVFRPRSFTLTLFVSAEEHSDTYGVPLRTLEIDGYRKRDQIVYEFEGYKLLFLSFQL
ncbi:adenosylmethionine decarboxylase [Malassezia vespertilionis]|uniref:adenosylmethionine decarboxylase n=1 Tax=Malassezia vespertilionis TaxID=2020962 RepID=A0A2N1JBS1_9BASI|nr:adenosylmethionine decarboxylase [Malassezia vespertilionis]PKI83995.1 Spe2p [Malassezia vespertilionis]WFD07067.1 adenosylmethionine decarboxylase [Malassezia vespertilionis]